MDTLSDITPKARKNHTCNFCEGLIPRGEKYHYQIISHDGKIYAWKSHLHCDEIAEVMDMYDFTYDDGLDAYSFQEFIWDEYYDMIKLHPEKKLSDKPEFLDVLNLVCKEHNVKIK